MAVFSHICCFQMEIRSGDVDASLHSFEELVRANAPRPDSLIVLPELWATGFDYAHVEALALRTPEVISCLREKAAQYNCWFAGSLLEGRPPSGRPSNTLFVVGPDGVAGTYRKQHLFSFWQEDEYLQPGRDPGPMDTPMGLLGGLVCYDLRFPGISRGQSFAGSRLIVVSAQWPAVRLDHWRLLLQARAVENQVFVAAANGCGAANFGELAGHSMIIDPDGEIAAEAGTSAGVIEAELDEQKLEAVRSRFCPAGERPWTGRDSGKIVSLQELETRLADIRRQGSKVVLTNGCFDLLHAGHVSYLEKARRCGDCLVVALNSDRSVRALKGDSRPVNSEQDRGRVLAALGCVDFVVLFDQDTPRQLIARLLPDVLVKGADWAEDEIAGAAEVKAAGGRVERIAFEHDVSTTAVIDKIRLG